MKKLLTIILILSATVQAADTELQDLTELTAIASTDVLYVVDDPSGTPASSKITALNLFDLIDTFAELNTITADKTLVNEEDAVTWDALGTFGLGITITTGDPFTLGTNRIDNGSDLLDGEMIGADTIDDDSIDFADITGADLTLTDCGAITSTGTITATVGFDIVGAADIDYGSADVTDHTFVTDGTGTAEIVLPAGSIDGTEILDDTIDSGDYAAASIDNEHLAADIIDETKIADDGIDSEHYNDGSIDLAHLAAGVYAKDLVTTAPVTGAADNIFVGADSDVTVALDFTAAWDFGGAASLELPQSATPTTDATGEIALDTTITNHQPLLQYYDGDENMTIIALPTANLGSTDNYIIKYDAASDDFQFEADASAGSTAWDDISDPDNSGLTTITFDNAELTLFTGDNDAAASFLTIQNSDADHTGGNLYLLDLDYSADDGDADADYIKCQDSGSVVFSVQQDGEVATDGGVTAGGTVEGATLTEGGVAVYNSGETPGGSLGGTWASPSIDDLFIKLGGDVASAGNYDFGGADLELPQAAPGAPDADGEIELDFTDGSVVVQHGSAHAELGAATDVVVGKLIRSFAATIFAPDGVNDVIPIKMIDDLEFPHGIVIVECLLQVGTDSNYTLTLQNYDDFDTINAGNGTIDAVAYTSGNNGEVTDTSITYGTIAAGQIIMMSIPSTDVDWVHIEIFYYEPIA